MEAVLIDLLVNISANIIYDTIKSLGRIVKLRKSKPNDIEKYVRENIKQVFSFIEDTEPVLLFLRSPQVTDIIKDYVFYKVTGELTGHFKREFRVSPIMQTDLVEYLSKGYVDSRKNSITSTPTVIIDKLLTSIIGIVKGYYLSQMNENDIASVLLTNDHNDYNTKVIGLMIERAVDHIISSLKYDIVHPYVDITSKKTKYHRIMKEKLSRAHIYMLDYFEFNSFYIPPLINRNNNEVLSDVGDIFYTFMDQVHEKWKHIFDFERVVYIVGGAGYGKSLFLRNIALNSNQMFLIGQEERLVIYGDLKNFIDHDGNIKPVIQFFRESMVSMSGMNHADFSDEFIQYYLDSGLCIILLDALDEVKEDKRNDVHLTVLSFLSCHNPNNKICITSRDRGFIKMNDDCFLYYIQPLSLAQIRLYIDNIINLRKFDPSDKIDFMKRTKPLIEKGFLRSFLILSLLVRIYKAERALPDNKLDLYHKCFDYISYTREVEEKKSINYNWERVSPLMNEDTFTRLAQLCAPYNNEVDASTVKEALIKANVKTFETPAVLNNAVNEFLRFCANRTELFVPGENEDTFKFFHRSFLDYFYALYIFKYVNAVTEIHFELGVFGFDSEVFELLLSLLKNKKRMTYDSLVEYVIKLSKDDLETSKPQFKPLYMLIAFMREITEKYYESEFLKLIISYSKILVRKSNRKDNIIVDPNRTIYSLLTRDPESNATYVKQFINKYKNGAINDVIMIATDIVKHSSGLRSYVFLVRWISLIGDECSFYTLAFIRLYGVKSFFESLRDQVFLKSVKSSEKSGQILTMLSDRFNDLDESKREEFEKLINSL
jgi:hypothetical protein